MVSKRNKHRKEAKKVVEKIPEKPIEEKPIEEKLTVPPMQDQQTLQGQPQENPLDNPMVNIILRLVEQFLRPKAPQTNAQMFQTFEQASIRKNMAEMSMDDYINQAVKKQMVKKLLGENFDEDGYKKAESNADHYMKPLREAGEKAKQAEALAKQQSENNE